MSAAWRVLTWVCICIWIPSGVSGALLVSSRDAQTQEAKETSGSKHIQKRSADSAEMVEVVSVTVACTVTLRFAHTVMATKALNKGNSSQEIFFEVELPKTAFITKFSMEIDGQVYLGAVKEKEKARKEYDKAVSSGKTAGLVKASGRTMEKFSVSVNIAAQSAVTFVLTYEELLQRKFGQYEILMRVKPAQPVQDFQIVADIYEPQGIKFVDAAASFFTNELMSLVDTTVLDTKAHISFSPTLEQQRKCPGCKETIIDGDFSIKYEVKREKALEDVQIVNGYFVHFFAPPNLPRVPKNVVFVIDRSGSMSGQKMEQTRTALAAILNDLHKEDHFALITFDSSIETWKGTLVKATAGNVSKAISYVKRIRDRGATDVNGALLKGVEMLKKERKQGKLPERSSDMIILLTDGMPNHGESDIPTIQRNVQSAVGGNMSLFCLGFGKDVQYSFLDVMARQNKGLARRIFVGSDAALQLQGFYDEVSSPLLLDVDLRYPENTVGLLTKNHFSQLFNGSEIVVAGHMDVGQANDNFLVEVLAKGPDEDFLKRGQAHVVDFEVMYPENSYIFESFAERLWAYLTIQQLLENSDLGTQQERDSRTAQALNMSLQYSFVTPLTSMVTSGRDPKATGTQRVIGHGPKYNRKVSRVVDDLCHKNGAILRVSGEDQCGEVDQNHCSYVWRPGPDFQQTLDLSDGDPHFLLELPERHDALCFNINDKPGTIFNLVKDPQSGFTVNGQIIGKNTVIPDGPHNALTYFGRLGISHRKLGVRMEVSTQDISILHNGKKTTLLWSNGASLKDNDMELSLVKNCSLKVALRHSVKFLVVRHTKVWKRRGDHQDYLGFYTLDSHHMSPSVHGLLGQFYHGVEYEVTYLDPDDVRENQSTTMYVKGHALNVTRHRQKDFSVNVKDGDKIPCWFVDNNGTGLIDGKASDYIVSSLFMTDF